MNYKYRNCDAILSTSFNFYFADTSEKLLNDAEIQNFGQELFKPKSENGCGILVRNLP